MRWLGLLGLVAAATLWALGRASAPSPRPDGAQVVREPTPESASPAGATLARVDPAGDGRSMETSEAREEPVARVGELRSLSFRPVLPDGRVPERVACEVVGLAAAGVPGRRRTIEVEGGVAHFELDLPSARSRKADEFGPPARAMLRIATAEEDLGALSGVALLSVEGVFAAVADLALLDMGSGGGSVALGVIHLEPPSYLGEVVFAGTWTDLARLEVSRGLFSILRRTVQTSRRRVPLWAYGASRSWSVSVTPRERCPSTRARRPRPTRGPLPSRTEACAARHRAVASLPVRPGPLRRSVRGPAGRPGRDPRGGRGSGPDDGRSDAREERLQRADRRSRLDERRAARAGEKGEGSYDIGPTDLPEGVLRLELWSVDDDRQVRELSRRGRSARHRHAEGLVALITAFWRGRSAGVRPGRSRERRATRARRPRRSGLRPAADRRGRAPRAERSRAAARGRRSRAGSPPRRSSGPPRA